MGKLNESEQEFVRKYHRNLLILSTISTGVLFSVLIPAYTGHLDLGRNTAPLNTELDRLFYTLKHLSVQLAWIVISMYYVIYHRIGTPALDPTKGYEMLCQTPKNMLTNSVEHGLVFIISQLIMSIDMAPDMCRRMIPTINLMYIVGRILYVLGYPCNRSFGFVIFNFITLLCVSYNLNQLIGVYA